jgi:hypothetical protein
MKYINFSSRHLNKNNSYYWVVTDSNVCVEIFGLIEAMWSLCMLNLHSVTGHVTPSNGCSNENVCSSAWASIRETILRQVNLASGVGWYSRSGIQVWLPESSVTEIDSSKWIINCAYDWFTGFIWYNSSINMTWYSK